MELNPAHIVAVTDFSPETLRNIIAHLEISTDFDHLIYREAELDALWSITGFALTHELHEIAHAAHDLVADGRPGEAAALLRSYL